jgi:hypothetical protein
MRKSVNGIIEGERELYADLELVLLHFILKSRDFTTTHGAEVAI